MKDVAGQSRNYQQHRSHPRENHRIKRLCSKKHGLKNTCRRDASDQAMPKPEQRWPQAIEKHQLQVEALFAELKGRIGLQRLRLRRLKFVQEQFFLAATAQNIKRLVRFLSTTTTGSATVTA